MLILSSIINVNVGVTKEREREREREREKLSPGGQGGMVVNCPLEHFKNSQFSLILSFIQYCSTNVLAKILNNFKLHLCLTFNLIDLCWTSQIVVLCTDCTHQRLSNSAN
jgi:hypothetical protein